MKILGVEFSFGTGTAFEDENEMLLSGADIVALIGAIINMTPQLIEIQNNDPVDGISDGVVDEIELESPQWMNNRYEPIACSLHDEYEIAIMHKKLIDIRWSGDDGEEYTDKVLPKDILVRDKAEFLVANTRDNRELCIRLDKIALL